MSFTLPVGLPFLSSCISTFQQFPHLFPRHFFSTTYLHFSTPGLFFFFFLRAALVAYGGSQAWGLIRATVACLCHNHRNVRSEPRTSVTYSTAHDNARSLTHWVGPGIKPTTSWFLVRVFSAAPWRELPPPTPGLFSHLITQILIFVESFFFFFLDYDCYFQNKSFILDQVEHFGTLFSNKLPTYFFISKGLLTC